MRSTLLNNFAKGEIAAKRHLTGQAQKMNNKKQILSAIIAVLISVGLVATAVYATTTVGNNVDVGGTLDVTSTTTLDTTLTVAGNTTLAGSLAANGGITVDTNNFIVDGTTGALAMTVATTTGNLAIILIDPAAITGTMTGLTVDISNISGGAFTETGLAVLLGGNASTSIGIVLEGNMDYGINMFTATATFDVMLQNGETIANTTNDIIAITAATTTFSGGIGIGNATSGIAFAGVVTNALNFASADGSQGASSTADFYAITSPTTSDALIKIDIGGTPYWIPAFDAASVTGE